MFQRQLGESSAAQAGWRLSGGTPTPAGWDTTEDDRQQLSMHSPICMDNAALGEHAVHQMLQVGDSVCMIL